MRVVQVLPVAVLGDHRRAPGRDFPHQRVQSSEHRTLLRNHTHHARGDGARQLSETVQLRQLFLLLLLLLTLAVGALLALLLLLLEEQRLAAAAALTLA